MKVQIVEIKAQCRQPDQIEKILLDHKAKFIGLDHQVDTYFNVPNGRLKLREGNIENNLIHYHRGNQEAPKASAVSLYKSTPDSSLKGVLTNALGIFKVVDKQRKIFFIDNVKFHIDNVANLGSFVEIEAIDETGTKSEDFLHQQCNYYLNVLNIKPDDLVAVSYSDMI